MRSVKELENNKKKYSEKQFWEITQAAILEIQNFVYEDDISSSLPGTYKEPGDSIINPETFVSSESEVSEKTLGKANLYSNDDIRENIKTVTNSFLGRNETYTIRQAITIIFTLIRAEKIEKSLLDYVTIKEQVWKEFFSNTEEKIKHYQLDKIFEDLKFEAKMRSKQRYDERRANYEHC